MASVRALAPIKSGGKWLPPGSVLHGVEEVQLRSWGSRVEVIADAGQDAQGMPVAASAPLGLPSSPETAATAPEPVPASEGEDADEGSRVEQTAMAIDILDTVDFEDDGRPKLAPLSAVLGFEPSPEELALALALRADEGL